MYYIKIIAQIIILIIFYLIGTEIQTWLRIPVPGSVIGMLLLFIVLMTNKVKVTWINDGASVLIRHLNLLFIPATVGIISFLHLFSGQGMLLIPIVLVSTTFVMIGSGFVSQFIMKRREKRV